MTRQGEERAGEGEIASRILAGLSHSLPVTFLVTRPLIGLLQPSRQKTETHFAV